MNSPLSKNTILILCIVIGLLAGIGSFVKRYVAEAHNRRVEVVIDYADAQALANTTSQAMDDVLTQLRRSGVTTVAITEDTLSTLASNGFIRPPTRDGNTTLLTFAPAFTRQMDRVQQMLAHKAPGLSVAPAGPNTLRVGAPWPQFSGLPIGLDDDAVRTVRRNHLLVTPRLLNFTGVTPGNIDWELAQVANQCNGALGPLIFSGAAVLGNRSQIDATRDALKADGLTYGTVEFSKTFGDEDLTRQAADRTVRVHSIGNDEMGTMEEPTAIERFVRAAKERNIRVCYVRLFLNGLTTEPDAQNVVDANARFIEKIVKGLEEARLTTGGAHPYTDDPTPSRPLRIVMAIGVVAGGLLLVRLFTGLDGKWFWAFLSIGLLLGIGLAWPGTSAKGREILALLAGCTFPTLGLCFYPLPATRPDATVLQAVGRAFAAYARMTLATLAGIVLVVGLLSGRLFLLKVDEFLGVKAILGAPVLLTAAFYGLGLAAQGSLVPWYARRARVMETLRTVFSQPLLIGQVVLGVIALGMLVLLMLRSGNDPGVGVSQTELHVRALLDKYLGVRPRTKEFLLGHPALFFALAAAASGRFGRWTLPLLVIGSIGQASLLDTFCHLHMPLYISLWRGFLGWVLGGLIGALVFVLAARVAPASPKVEPCAQPA